MGDSVNPIERYETSRRNIPENLQSHASSKMIEIVNSIQDHTVDNQTTILLESTLRDDLQIDAETTENQLPLTNFASHSENRVHLIPPRGVECCKITNLLLNRRDERLSTLRPNKIEPNRNQIDALENPIVIEQLQNFMYLIELKSTEIKRENFSKCVKQAVKIAKRSHRSSYEKIAKLIYIIDHSPELAIDHSNMQTRQFMDWIDSYFECCLQNKIEGLEKYFIRHRKAGIQNAEVAYRNQLPIEISRFLISSTGRINTGLINIMIQTFIKDIESPLNYEKALLNNLKQLETAPELREQVLQISAPIHPRAPANVIIRTTLGLALNSEITDLHAKQTAVASLLSPIRQGRGGSCFATPLAIYLLSHHQNMCLDDFYNILLLSKLTKNVNGSLIDFPFLLRIGDQDLERTVKLNSSGTHIVCNGKLRSLKKVPGLQAVKHALGLKKIKILSCLSVPRDDDGGYTVSIKNIIYACVKQAQKLSINQEKALSELIIHAFFAYEAEECNPLLKMWENTIAGMAEADEHSMVRSVIISSLKRVISRFLEQSGCSTDFQKQFLLTFTEILNNHMHLQWDPKISDTLLRVDQKSIEGAFILYDKGVDHRPQQWERIDNPHAYQRFIHRTVHEAIEKLERAESNSPLNALLEYLDSDLFLSDNLCDYCSDECGCDNLFKDYEKLRFTPWTTKSGNNLEKVFQIYFEQPLLKSSRQINPINGEQLLEQFIVLVNEMEWAEGLHTRLIPVRIPYVHAFTLLIGHSTLAQYSVEDSNSDLFAMLRSSLMDAGNQVSSYQVPTKLKGKIINGIRSGVIDKSKRRKFDRFTRRLQHPLTIRELWRSLMKIIAKIHSSNPEMLKAVSFQVDDITYQLLPGKLKKKLAKSAIHIADSNWADGINAIHLCLVVNPGVGRIELWGSKDDQSEIYPLDQSVWFENGKWEIFTNFL